MMKTRDAHPIGIAWVTLVFLSVPVLLYLPDYGAASSGLRVPLVAAASGLVTFSIIAVLFWVSRVRPIRFGDDWHRSRAGESLERYRALGVDTFRRWLLRSPFRALNADVHTSDRSSRGLAELAAKMDATEANHILAFVLTLPVTAIYAFGNSIEFLPWLVMLNTVGNLYPALLQRMNRLRVARLLRRKPREGSGSCDRE